MYQFSLKYFSSVFNSVISAEHEKMPLPERLQTLMADEVYAIYLNVSRGLFEKHKLIFSFLLAIAVEKQEKRVTNEEISFLIRGPLGNLKIGEKSDDIHINEYAWKCCCFLEHEFQEFKGLCKDLKRKIIINMGEMSQVVKTIPFNIVYVLN